MTNLDNSYKGEQVTKKSDSGRADRSESKLGMASTVQGLSPEEEAFKASLEGVMCEVMGDVTYRIENEKLKDPVAVPIALSLS
jgi:hypothetical protein